MTKTEYLFGFPKEKYIGIPFPQVGMSRIKDAEVLLENLRQQAYQEPVIMDEAYQELRVRIYKVFEAIRTWKKILEIEKE